VKEKVKREERRVECRGGRSKKKEVGRSREYEGLGAGYWKIKEEDAMGRRLNC